MKYFHIYKTRNKIINSPRWSIHLRFFLSVESVKKFQFFLNLTYKFLVSWISIPPPSPTSPLRFICLHTYFHIFDNLWIYREGNLDNSRTKPMTRKVAIFQGKILSYSHVTLSTLWHSSFYSEWSIWQPHGWVSERNKGNKMKFLKHVISNRHSWILKASPNAAVRLKNN